MDRSFARRPLPQSLLNRAFDVADARLAGVGRDRLRGDDLEAPHHGIRVPAGALRSMRDRARGLTPALRPGQFFSHLTAAAIWECPLPSRFDAEAKLHVMSIRPQRAMRRPGVVGHSTERVDSTMRDGMPVALPETAWVQCAPLLSPSELVVAADALVSRDHGVTTPERLAAEISAAGGTRFITNARQALAKVRIGAESPKETETRLAIPDHIVDDAELNIDVYSGSSFLGRPDIVFVDAMVTVEYEGDHHRTDRTTFRNDILRRQRFTDAG